MSHPPDLFRVVIMNRPLIIALAMAAIRAPLIGQSTPDSSSWCFRGRPYPECRHFVLLEFSTNERAATTHDPGEAQAGIPEDGESIVSMGLGWMTNHPDGTATGGMIEVGGTQWNTRYVVEARRRRWVNRWLAGDLGAGLLALHPNYSRNGVYHSGVGLTGHAGFVVADLLTLTAGVDLIQSRRTQASATLGIRCGSWTTAGLFGVLGLFVATYHDNS
jgi:hypothetical protein